MQCAQFLQITLLVQQAFTLQLLPLDLLIGQLRHSILPILSVAAEDALIEDISRVVDQLQGVHSGAFEPMKGLVAVTALDSCAFSLAAEAGELLVVDQVVERFADIDPLLALDAEPRVLVILDAVLVKEERLADELGVLVFVGSTLILIFAERSNKGLVSLLAETALLLPWL